MNYIKHLTAYFDRVVTDHTLNPTHISLYIALFQFWNINRFQNPISITRDEVMRISKICSKATYHKCMRELHDKGYVIYEPSYNPFRGSMVHLVELSQDLKPMQKRERTYLKNKQDIEQAQNKHQTSSETAAEQVLVSSINSINNTNSTNITNGNKQEKATYYKVVTNQPTLDHPELAARAQKKAIRKKKTDLATSIPPDWQNVLLFFIEKNATETDAQKFYNHFQSNGWLVGGKSKMKDWKAAARNWLLNSQKFSNSNATPQPNHLHTPNQKNYGEPL